MEHAKRFLCLTLTLFLLLGCGAAPAEGTPLKTVHCEEQGFSLRIPEGLDARWEDGAGMRISVEHAGYVPYVLVTRRETNLNNPVNYLNNVYREYMEDQYGDRMIGTRPCKTVDVGGKSLYAATYEYYSGETHLCFMRLVEQREDGDVEYGAKYVDGDSEATMAVLAQVIASYQPDVADAPGGSGTDELAPALPTALYQDPRFHVLLPEGWRILPQGEHEGFCFRAWDPESPNRAFFFFMKLEPFLKSQQAKAYYRGLSGGNPQNIYSLYSEAPVMESCTMEAFLKVVPEIRAYCSTFYPLGMVISPDVVPQINQVRVLQRAAGTSPAPADCKDNSVLMLSWTDDNGQACEGLISGQARDPMQYIFNGIDTMGYTVSLVMGVSAPAGELTGIEDTLLECLSSFGFEDWYQRQFTN